MGIAQTARKATRIGGTLKRSGRNKRRGGGGFGARYKPPKAGERLTPILLFRGRYTIKLGQADGSVREDVLDYDIRCEHFSKAAMRGLTCTAGLVEDNEGYITEGNAPCVPCYEYREHGTKGMNARKIHIINGILLADFHLVDSAREKQQNGRGTGEYYKDYVECLGRRCTHCKQGIEKRFGRAVYMPLGNSFVQQLADFDLITLASECRCGGTLEPVGFVCPNCNMEFADLEKTGATDKEIQQLREQAFRCKHCGEYGFMEEVSLCNQCDDPRPLTMWDTALELYRSGDGVNTSLQVNKHWPVQEDMIEAIKDLMVPVDTDKIYKHLTPAEQAELFKLPLPSGFDPNGGRGGGKSSTRWDD